MFQKASFITICTLSLLTAFIVSAETDYFLPDKIHPTAHSIPIRSKPIQHASEKIRVQLINYHNMFYLANLTIGSNLQQFQLIVDNNSPVSWITSPDFTDVKAIKNHFYCNQSETCVETDQVYDYTLMDLNITGHVIQDQIVFQNNYTLANQTILSVDHIQKNKIVRERYPMLQNVLHHLSSIDGILGLGYNNTDVEFVSIIDNIQQQNLIDEVAYAVFLSYNHEGGVDGYSQLVIGQHDPHYLKTHNYTIFPVLADQKGWAVGVNSVFIGQSKITNQGAALISTASPFIQAPKVAWDDLINILNQVNKTCRFDPRAKFVYCDCQGTQEIEKFPALVFYLNQKDGVKKLKVSPERYVQFSHGKCFLAIQKGKEFDGWVLGDAFLREYYSYYAYEEGFLALTPVRPHED